MATRTLLLVDTRVGDFQQIVAAVNANTVPVVYDPESDTYASLLQKIAAQNVTAFSSVGVVQHGSAALPEYQILSTDHGIVRRVQKSDPTLASWAPISDFFKALKTTYGIQTVDLMACSLYANSDMIYALTQLETQVGVNFRASTDATGNIAQAANWTMESDNVNVKDVYFTDAIDSYVHIFGIATGTGSIISRNITIGALTPVAPMISASVPVINMMESDPSACTLVPWGNSYRSSIRDVIATAMNGSAYAALKRDGSVVVWGTSSYGGTVSAGIAAKLASGVVSITSTSSAFAALKTDGSVVTWGSSTAGGNSTSVAANLSSGVSAIAATDAAFAALKTDGSVVVWGNTSYGGNASSVAADLGSGVVAIATTINSFAALKNNGTVVCWGAISTVPAELSNVVALSSTAYAFTAITSSGSAVAWGDVTAGGNSSVIYVDGTSDLTNTGSISSGVTAIAASATAFAALKSNGSVVAWGDSTSGGNVLNVSGVSSGVIAIAATDSAFAALKNDGSVVVWGNTSYGGSAGAAASSLSSNVTSIVPTLYAFAALKNDGSVVAWGDSTLGGSTTAVAASLTSNVVSISSTGGAFAALKSDGSVVTWGTVTSNAGFDSSLIGSQVRRVAALGGSGFGAFRNQTPDAPTIGTATAGDAQASITFTAPAYNGGAAITSYTITSSPSGITATGSSSPIIVSGLTNGTSYTFTVTATNELGASSASSATGSVTPITTPGAPTIDTVTAGNGQVTVTFTEPGSTGGSAITSYTVTSSPGGFTATGGSSPITVSGLTNGTAYTFTVTATNAAGTGAASAASSSVTPKTVPDAPTIGTATAGDGQATVTFTPPAFNGGATIFGYQVLSTPGNKTATGGSSPITVSGLTNGTAYTFRVRASNAAGDSSYSSASDSVTPAAASPPPSPPSSFSIEAGNQQLTIRWSASASASTYAIYNASNVPITTNISINHSTRTAVHTGLTNGLRYGYKIAAISAAGAEGDKTAVKYGVPANLDDLGSTVSTTIFQEANNNAGVALPVIVSLLESLTTTEQKNTVAGAAAQSVATNAISSNASSPTGTKIQSIASEVADITTNLPVEQSSAIAQQIVSSVAGSNDLTAAEKIAALARAINTVGATSPEMKTAFVEQLSSQGAFTAAPIALTQAQTTALFASRPNLVNPPSTVKIAVPAGNTIVLSDTEAVYILMKPSVNYNFTHNQTSVSLMYNPSTQMLVGTGINVSPGSILTVGTWSGRIFAAGSAGVTPVTVPGAPTNVSATAGNASASVSWTAPSSDGGSALTGYTVISNPAGGVTAPIDGSTTSATVTGLTNGTSYTFTVTATNEVGTGSASSASNSVTPTAPGGGGGGGGGAPCFPAGVRIRTPHGEKPVETLRTGDLILTAAGHAVPIRMHSYEIACTTTANAPYFIPAGALGPKAPAKPLHLSPLHAFQIRPNVWWNAQEAAKVSTKLEQYGLGSPLTYYHVECPNFLRDNLVADGVVVESFAANQLTKDQKHNLYKYSKKLGGFVRNGRAVM